MRHLLRALSARPPQPTPLLPLPAPARWAAPAKLCHSKQWLVLLLVTSSGLPDATAQSTPPTVRYSQLSKTLDSLFYVDQWPMQRMLKQQPDSAGRNLEHVEKENFARHQPLLEKIIREQSAEVIESVVWKVIPELATQIIERELSKLLKERDALKF